MTLASALRPLLQALVRRSVREKRLKRQRLIKLLSDAGRRGSGEKRVCLSDYLSSRGGRLTP